MAAGRSWLALAFRRIGDEPALVGAAVLVALVAATVAAACVVHPELTSRRGLLAALGARDPAEVDVVVALDAAPAERAAADAAVASSLAQALGPVAGPVGRTARSGSWQLPGGTGLAYPPLTSFAWDDGLEARTVLVAGSWPRDGAADRPEVAITTGAAAALDVGAGAELELTSRADPARRVRAVVSAVVAIADPLDPAWGGDALVLEGAAQPGSFPQRGPLFTTLGTIEALAGSDDLALGWRAIPTLERFEPDLLEPVRAGVAGLESRLERDLGADRATVTTELPETLAAAGAGVVAGRGGTTIIALQLLVLAAYALVLIAALVFDQRRATSDVITARGAAGSAIVGLAALEGALIALPAVLLGPPLAVALVGLLAGGGTDAGGGAAALPEPRLAGDAIALAALTGLVVVAAFALPAVVAAAPFTRMRARLSRGAPRGMVERTGIDLALVVLAGLALWQLREAGAPLATAGARGLGVDPLLAIAPAVGLLAGGLLALRVGPFVGALLERPAAASTGAVAALAGRAVARRSAEAGRAALLVVVATGFVLFTLAYGRTWTAAQGDQVAAAVPAGVVGTAPAGPTAPPDWVVRDRLLALPDVAGAAPAARETFSIGAAVARGTLLAVPAEAAGRSLEAGADDAGRPLADLAGSLAGGRADVPVLALPGGATAVELRVRPDLAAAAGPDGTTRPIPDGWAGLVPAVVVRDGSGLLHRLAGPAGRVAGGAQVLEVPLTSAADEQPARLEPPLDLVGVELELTLPEGVAASGAVHLDGVAARGPETTDGQPVDLAPARDGWLPLRSTFGVAPAPLPAEPSGGLGARLAEPVVGPVPVVVALRPGPDPVAAAALPAIVDRSAAIAAGLAVGDVVPVARGASDVVLVRIDGVVDLLPGVAPGGLLLDLPALALRDFLRAGSLPPATEWWVEPAPGADPDSLAAGAEAAGLGDVRVRSELLAARLADPLAQGVLGALGLAAAAALAIAAVAFAVATWRSARAREYELAVVRSLGLPPGPSTAWLALELAFGLALGVAGGIALGLALAWAVLPSVTVTPDGSPAVPPPVVVMPWDAVLVVVAAGLLVYLALVAMLRLRRGSGDLAATLREAAP